MNDRFHLFKNLTDYAIEYLKKHLNKVIKIVVDCTDKAKSISPTTGKNGKIRKLTLEEKYHKILLMQAGNKNQTEICREINMDVRCYKKLIAASDEERNKLFGTATNTRHEEIVSNKMKIVSKVRALNQKGLSKRAISRETGLSTTTISRYLDESFNPVHASYGIKKPGILSAYHEEIDILLNQGAMTSKIEKIIRDKGFKGSSSTIRHYASEWKKKFKINTEKSETVKGEET